MTTDRLEYLERRIGELEHENALLRKSLAETEAELRESKRTIEAAFPTKPEPRPPISFGEIKPLTGNTSGRFE